MAAVSPRHAASGWPPATGLAGQPPALNVREAGSPGRTLVFGPGLGGTTRYWEGRLGALAQQYHAVLVDPLGFGESPRPWMRYTVERHIQALHQALSQAAPFTLVGHSMGALLAVAYAARHPADVEGLVLLGLPYFGSPEKALRFFRKGSWVNRIFLSNMLLAAVICVLTRRVFAWLVPYLQPDLPREVAADVVRHSWRSFTSSLWEVVYNYDAARDADRLNRRLPVVCLHGDRDITAPLEGVQALAQGRPNWRVQVLSGVDHHPLLRAPAECYRAIEAVTRREDLGPQEAELV